ncbi:unnamed protein product [Protopolystoma xenopodis]|uniref:Ras-related protein Rab-39B n=1 Tax=Protopolystoma xenopodis TaxID=117903 RepID=A0A3S5AA42_9PLAT|nr:unnamed protein product [Protopolystoma xenopodis]
MSASSNGFILLVCFSNFRIMINPYFDYQFRIILIGDSMVGKSSLVKAFSDGDFTSLCDPTVGVDFCTRTIVLENGIRIKLQLWDTAGQEKFRSITRSYYRNSVGALLLFDITNRETLEHIPEWYEEAILCIKCPMPAFVLVGHKADRQSERQASNVSQSHLEFAYDNI